VSSFVPQPTIDSLADNSRVLGHLAHSTVLVLDWVLVSSVSFDQRRWRALNRNAQRSFDFREFPPTPSLSRSKRRHLQSETDGGARREQETRRMVQKSLARAVKVGNSTMMLGKRIILFDEVYRA